MTVLVRERIVPALKRFHCHNYIIFVYFKVLEESARTLEEQRSRSEHRRIISGSSSISRSPSPAIRSSVDSEFVSFFMFCILNSAVSSYGFLNAPYSYIYHIILVLCIVPAWSCFL